MVQRLKRHGFRGALILGASRLLVTLVLLGGVYVPGVLENESAKLLVLGAIVGYWLGHGGDMDSGTMDNGQSPQQPHRRTTDRHTTDTVGSEDQ